MGQAKKFKEIRKQIRKTILPEAIDEAEKMKLMQAKRPKWLPRKIYYWLCDQIINFKENMGFTEKVWLEYRCDKCGNFSQEKYLQNHPTDDPYLAVQHSCESYDTVLMDRKNLYEASVVKVDPLARKIPVFSGERIKNDSEEEI